MRLKESTEVSMKFFMCQLRSLDVYLLSHKKLLLIFKHGKTISKSFLLAVK